MIAAATPLLAGAARSGPLLAHTVLAQTVLAHTVLGTPRPGIGREAAQQLARRELSRAIYQPSVTDQVLSWLGRHLTRLFTDLNRGIPGGWWALVALIVAAVLAIAVVLFYVRPATVRRRASGAVLTGTGLSAGEHRALAERLAAAGDYAGAIIERLRAIAVELELRGVLPPRPGRTAAELAAEAGRALPGQAGELGAAARLFDDVRYGGRDGTSAGYQRLSELDHAILAARPADAATPLTARSAAGAPS